MDNGCAAFRGLFLWLIGLPNLYCLLLPYALADATNLNQLKVLQPLYPKSIYFRNAENSAANEAISFEKWHQRWSKLDGMVVKALDEEIPGRSNEAQKKFIQYKRLNPQKLMLLHFNGDARDPHFDVEVFQPIHWTYFVGCDAKAVIPATAQDTRIDVDDVSLFRVNMAKRKGYNDDIALVEREPNGQLNWRHVEQVKLLAIDDVNKQLVVKRAAFGSEALHFNHAYLAPHVSQPPQSPLSSQGLWRYNFTHLAEAPNVSTAEVLANNLASYLGEGGKLQNFDGIEFDVLADKRGIHHQSRQSKIDYNFDGVYDHRDKLAQARYSNGVHLFIFSLRALLGPNKLILADGNELNQQREFDLLNGIESESWPNHQDHQLEQWSSGLNRHNYWNIRCYSPCFSYIKMGQLAAFRGTKRLPEENYRRLRLAAALFMGAAIAPAYRPVGLKLDNWPELTGGKPLDYAWLGKPVSDASLLATKEANLTWTPLLDQLIAGKGTELVQQGENQWFSAKKAVKLQLKLTLPEASDVVLQLKAKAERVRQSEPATRAYWLKLSAMNNQSQYTWLGDTLTQSRFYFKQLSQGENIIEFELEPGVLLQINELELMLGSEILYREFENGFVVANPSREVKTIKLPEHLIERYPTLISGFYSLPNQLFSQFITIPAKDAAFYRWATAKGD